MTGRFHIDGIDAYSEFGVLVADGGFAGLVQYPPLKPVDTIDWHEEDGIEADLYAPVLDTKTFQVMFVAHRQCDVGGFIALLSDKGYHDFAVPALGRTFRLRLVGNPSMSVYPKLEFLTLQLADDFPLEGYTYVEPVSAIAAYGDYELDGRLFTDYGVRILEGTLAEIKKSPAVKPNLLRNISIKPGAAYDGRKVTFQAKDVAIKCCMRADSMDEFWSNHHALIYDLTRPGERQLYVDATGEEYSCYYKSCSANAFAIINSGVWFEFTLTLRFTSFRPNSIQRNA